MSSYIFIEENNEVTQVFCSNSSAKNNVVFKCEMKLCCNFSLIMLMYLNIFRVQMTTYIMTDTPTTLSVYVPL